MKYKFTKIQNNHNELRDDVILCDTCSDIVIGQPMFLTAPSRDLQVDGAFRYIHTSPVTAFDKLNESVVRITTRSGSTYDIETL